MPALFSTPGIRPALIHTCRAAIKKALHPHIRDEDCNSAVPPKFPLCKSGLFIATPLYRQNVLRFLSSRMFPHSSVYCVLYVNGQAPASPTIIPPIAAKPRSGFVPVIRLQFQDAAPEGTSPVCTLEMLSAVAAPLFKVRSGYFPLSWL